MPVEARPIEQRFWRFVRKDPSGCWLWTGATAPAVDGYGSIAIKRSKPVGAHRVSWEMANGRKVPPGLCVLHTCDVRLCVNPAHLYVGTRKDNVRDALVRGRHIVGSDHAHAKLTEAAVIDIRTRRASGERARDLAREYGVSIAAIDNACAGKTWKHVPLR